MKKNLFTVTLFFCSFSLYAQEDTMSNLFTKLSLLQKENQTLSRITDSYNYQIDSLIQLVGSADNQEDILRLMIKNEANLSQLTRDKMKVLVVMIDDLNGIIKKDEE